MSADNKEQAEPEADDLEVSVDEAIAACEGDLRATVRALVVANNFSMRGASVWKR